MNYCIYYEFSWKIAIWPVGTLLGLVSPAIYNNFITHDDVVKRKHFPRYRSALCAGNSPVTGEFPSQGPVTWIFDVSFGVHQDERLSKRTRCWWFETPWRSLWCHCNVIARGNRQDGCLVILKNSSDTRPWNILLWQYENVAFRHLWLVWLKFTILSRIINNGSNNKYSSKDDDAGITLSWM